jgi:ferrous iron transport protein A
LKTLAQAPLNETLIVRSVTAPDYAPEWAQWLEDIGFIPGEAVTVLASGALGADPLAVRIGVSTFALRRVEAACVRVEPSQAAPRPAA